MRVNRRTLEAFAIVVFAVSCRHDSTGVQGLLESRSESMTPPATPIGPRR